MSIKKFFAFNIFLFGFCFLFFNSLKSYASTTFVVSFSQHYGGLDSYYQYNMSFDTFNIDSRFCVYVESVEDNLNPYRIYLVSTTNIEYHWDSTRYYPSGSSDFDSGYSYTTGTVGDDNIVLSSLGGAYSYSFRDIISFNDYDDAVYYVLNGTLPSKPFSEDVMLDSFKVYSKGHIVEGTGNTLAATFNQIVVQPKWSNVDITSVEVSVYATNPDFRYNTLNWTYEASDSGLFHIFDVSGLTLHDQKFMVVATPFSSSNRGVAIAYEFTFPNTFDQPLGDLVIKEPNTYPYSTTLDISGNDVPIEWTVTQTPIYIYETNNYYGEPVSYPVPEITETTNENYYQEYIDNYYNDYTTVINNYNNTFDFDFGDVTGNDIQQGYDDVGGFLNGIGNLISKLSSLFSGLFPFLSPLVAVSLVTVFGLVVIVGGIVLFIKIIKALLP